LPISDHIARDDSPSTPQSQVEPYQPAEEGAEGAVAEARCARPSKDAEPHGQEGAADESAERRASSTSGASVLSPVEAYFETFCSRRYYDLADEYMQRDEQQQAEEQEGTSDAEHASSAVVPDPSASSAVVPDSGGERSEESPSAVPPLRMDLPRDQHGEPKKHCCTAPPEMRHDVDEQGQSNTWQPPTASPELRSRQPPKHAELSLDTGWEELGRSKEDTEVNFWAPSAFG